MHKTVWATLLATTASVATAYADNHKAEAKQREQRLQHLEAEIQTLRKEVTNAREASAKAQKSKGLCFGPDQSLQLTLRPTLHVLADFGELRNDSMWIPGTPLMGLDGQHGKKGNFSATPAGTRLGFRTCHKTHGNDLKTKIEFDFNARSSAGRIKIRLRHSYISWGPFLLGQTNTLFQDGSAMPDTVDLSGIMNGPTRQAQIRLSHKFDSGWSIGVSAERPFTETVFRKWSSGPNPTALDAATAAANTADTAAAAAAAATAATAANARAGARNAVNRAITAMGHLDVARGYSVNIPSNTIGSEGPNATEGIRTRGTYSQPSMPDLVASLRYDHAAGHLGVRGIVRQMRVRYTPSYGSDRNFGKEHMAYGVGVSGSVWLASNVVRLVAQANIGNGIGRYIPEGSNGLYLDVLGQRSELVKSYNYLGAIEMRWTPKVRTHLMYQHVNNKAPRILPAEIQNWNHKMDQVVVNTFYKPISNVNIGFEYMYGLRTTRADNTNTVRKGNVHRIQACIMYNF